MMKVKSPLITVDSKYIPASFRHSKVVKMQGHHGDKSKLYIYGKIKEKRIESTHVSFKRRRFASFFSFRTKRIKTTREVAEQRDPANLLH